MRKNFSWKRIRMNLSKWWMAWYGGPLLMALSFGMVSYHFASGDGHSGMEKKIMASPQMDAVNKLLSLKYKESKDVVFIDVSYSKQLVPTILELNEIDTVTGEIAITNRRQLLELLQFLSKDVNYKAIILDVGLDAKAPTSDDSALVSTLLHLPRVVITDTLENGQLLDSQMEIIAGSTAYNVNVSDAGFIKYPLFYDGKKSLPLVLYEKTTHRKMKHLFGSLYVDGFSLACEHLFPILHDRIDNSNDYYYLGNADYDDIDFKDKYIVVGAINEGDNHRTYKGRISGPEININTYFAMLHGQHRINIFSIILVLGGFYLLSFSIVRNKWKLTNRMQNSQSWPVRAAGLIMSAFIYTILLGLLFLVNYLIFNQVLTFISVSVGFLIINKIIVTH